MKYKLFFLVSASIASLITTLYFYEDKNPKHGLDANVVSDNNGIEKRISDVETSIDENYEISADEVDIFEEIELPDHVKSDPFFRSVVIKLKKSIEENNTPAGELTQEQFDLAMLLTSEEMTSDPEEINSLRRMLATNKFNDYFYRTDMSQEEREEAAVSLSEFFSSPEIVDSLYPADRLEALKSILSSVPEDSPARDIVRDKIVAVFIESNIQLQSSANSSAALSLDSEDPQQPETAQQPNLSDAEMSIVNRVLQMESIPDGLTRQQYLDKLLDELHSRQ